jgi:phenylpropionate dioxygenase-like ring-hydroxylating dioxygenase large terminal subunit
MTLPADIETTWLPVALARHVGAKPVRREIAGHALVLWRSPAGIHAFRDRCPHRNFPLSKGRVEGGQLVCPYHGWHFTGEGACAEVPGCARDGLSRLGAETLAVEELDGAVFVRLNGGEDRNWAATLPPMPDTPDFDHFWWAQRPTRARVYDALDNVLDPFHTNFIHDGLIRVKGRRQTVIQTIRAFERHFEATYVQDTDYGWMSRALEGPRSQSRGYYYPPVVFQGRWEGPSGLNLCVTIWFVPESETVIRTMARFSTPKSKGPAWLKQALIRLFLLPVIDQDARALEQLHDNIACFGGPRFKAGPGDHLTDRLAALYQGRSLEPGESGPFHMEL